MENYKNFSTYKPENVPVDVLVLPDGRPALMTWLRDEEGNDWYDVQQNFADDTLKVLYDSNSIICGCSMDVTELNPINMSVTEISVADVPPEATDTLTDGTWCYLDGKIQPYQPTPDELQKITQKLKAELLADASQHIAILQDIIDYDTPTDDEKYQLVAWKKYRIDLSRIRPENAPKITWPSKPE